MRILLVALLFCAMVIPATATAETPSHYYVDPAGGNDTTGDGTIGTPWKTIQKALNTIEKDSTNGDQINIKAGVDDVLAAPLDLSEYGTPGIRQLAFCGYTSTANDGGTGGINANGSTTFAAVSNYLRFENMHIHNSGANTLLATGTRARLFNCELNNCTGAANSCLDVLNNSLVMGCYVHTFEGYGIRSNGSNGAEVDFIGNYVSDDSCVYGMWVHDRSNTLRNIIVVGSVTCGLSTGSGRILNNSILSTTGTGKGLSAYNLSHVAGNLIVGFSSGTAVGSSPPVSSGTFADNAFYNCGTILSEGNIPINEWGNEILESSPFAATGDLTFANRFTYFSPVDVGNVRGGAWQAGAGIDKGAVQHAAAAGGGGGRSYIIGASFSGDFKASLQEMSSRSINNN
jgi:hypothetical protein